MRIGLALLFTLMSYSATWGVEDNHHATATHTGTAHAEPVHAVPVRYDEKEEFAQGLDAKQALARLMEGNKRFVNDVVNKTHKDVYRRMLLTKGQHPFAIVVCCSDSRIPPELLFDVGLGDIFVIRVAGNVVGDLELGSIEYAAAHLHVPLVVVMGHEKCGAVSAAISGQEPHGHILSIVEKIHQNLSGTNPGTGDVLDQAVCLNAMAVAQNIRVAVPILKQLVDTGALTVVAARYDLDEGEVTLLPK